MIQVAIIEDDQHLRASLQSFVHSQEDMTCQLVAGSVEDFLEKTSSNDSIQVLIQDIGLPGMSGLDGISLIKNRFPNIKILMFSVFDDSDRIFKALCAGAAGYLKKDTLLTKMVEAIRNVHEGHAAMSPSIAKKVIDYFKPKKATSPLSPKEQQVVQGLVDGLSYKMIADQLLISTNTVNYHIRNIYKKLEVNSKAEVISKKLKGEI